MSDYQTFLARKWGCVKPCGFDVTDADLNQALFPWQREIVKWALKRGRAALFEDCGLGKTAQQLEWAKHVARHTGGTVLILAPLAVAEQTRREGEKFGVAVTKCREAVDIVAGGVNVTNYERLEKFEGVKLAGIVLDESSILKSFDGKMRRQIQEFAGRCQYRLCCTATPAPNDLIELTNHAEFLDIMRGKEMLALFFRQDGNTTHAWRLKGHARESFWKWMSSWSIAIRKPSDIGFGDDGFRLPNLNMVEEVVEQPTHEGYLFAVEAQTLQERRAARRDSLGIRVARCAELANGNDEQWLVWCDLNDEGDALAKSIMGAVQVKGSDDADFKEEALNGFAQGKIRVLVSKPSIAGFGMNFQRCHNVVFVGLSDSYESFYQAVRRCWRFGQKHVVECHVVTSEAEGAVVANIHRKEQQSTAMFEGIVRAMDGGLNAAMAKHDQMEYAPTEPMNVPAWLKEVA